MESRVDAIMEAITKKEIANGGRWAEVTMKSTGDAVTIIRLGYGPMERPEWDEHRVLVNGQEVLDRRFSNLTAVAKWINENY